MEGEEEKRGMEINSFKKKREKAFMNQYLQ